MWLAFSIPISVLLSIAGLYSRVQGETGLDFAAFDAAGNPSGLDYGQIASLGVYYYFIIQIVLALLVRQAVELIELKDTDPWP